MFYVVQLDSDEFKEKMVVPSIWLDKTNTFCLLPPVVDIVEIKRQAEAQTSPKHGWQMHNLSFIQSFDTFSEAKQNVEMNKNESVMIELDEDEEDCLQRKDRERRKRKRPAFLENYVTETYDNEETHKTMQGSIENSIIMPEPLIIKQEPLEDTTASECQQQQQTINCDKIMTDCRVLLERNFQIPDSSSSKVSPTVNSMSTKCACNSCHKMIFQSLAALRKQVEDNSCKLNEILHKLRTSESNSNAVNILPEEGAATDSSETPPTSELNKVVSPNMYSNNQHAESEAANVKEIEEKTSTMTPFIATLSDSLYTAQEFIIFCDGKACIYTQNFISALSVLFAVFFVFNIEYPEGAGITLEFIQRLYAGINPSGGSRKMASPVHRKILRLVDELKSFELVFNCK